MAYCNESHVDAIFNSLNLDQAADDNADGTANTGLWTLEIDNASHEVWSYLKPHYSTLDPEDVTDVTDKTQVPVMVRNAAATIAAAEVLGRQGRGLPAPLREKLDYLRRENGWLDKLSQGVVTVDAVTSRTAQSTTDGVPRTFRPQGPMQHYGDVDPGNADDTNDFYRVNTSTND